MRESANTFVDLIVWQKAHQFVLEVYRLTQAYPRSEIYGLTPQFRRAVVSVPANIAEGFRKRGNKDKLRFYSIAQGSLEEWRYYLIPTRDLEYGDISDASCLLIEASKLLEAYCRSILNPES